MFNLTVLHNCVWSSGPNVFNVWLWWPQSEPLYFLSACFQTDNDAKTMQNRYLSHQNLFELDLLNLRPYVLRFTGPSRWLCPLQPLATQATSFMWHTLLDFTSWQLTQRFQQLFACFVCSNSPFSISSHGRLHNIWRDRLQSKSWFIYRIFYFLMNDFAFHV